jgi:hypothetical protein
MQDIEYSRVVSEAHAEKQGSMFQVCDVILAIVESALKCTMMHPQKAPKQFEWIAP